MPDSLVTVEVEAAPRSSHEALLTAIKAAVLAVPGVVRLEPTLSTGGPAVLLRRGPTDGIRLLDRAGVVDVDVDIATAAAWQAREVTHHVQAGLAALLLVHGYVAGSVTVSVLTIEAVPELP